MSDVDAKTSPSGTLRFVTPTSVLSALFVGSLLIIIAMGWHLWKIDTAAEVQNPVITGINVFPVIAHDMEGKEVTIPIGHTDRPIVLYVFSPACGWCARNLNNIRALASARRDAFEFIGISRFDTILRTFVSSIKLPFPAYSISAISDVHPLQLNSTPQTIVISPEGKIVKNWIGAFAGTQQSQIENYFDIRLPGLANP